MVFEDMKIELWVIFQIVVDFILVVLILWLLKNMKFRLQQDISKDTSEKVMEMIEPLLTQANHIATTFGKQLKEKNHLIHKLNEKLDSRIISLNLLLNRTESLLGKGNKDSESPSIHAYDQQESILQMYVAGKSPSEIAKTLSLPKGEVALVLDLKKKLLTIQ